MNEYPGNAYKKYPSRSVVDKAFCKSKAVRVEGRGEATVSNPLVWI